jgi:hypothetical protein
MIHPPSESASESSNSPQTSFECGEEGLKYVAGFLAHKFRIKYPEFGEKTRNLSSFERNDCPWICALSRGGLTAPSEDFFSKIKKFENTFKELHGNSIDRNFQIISNATKKICLENPGFPAEVVKTFVKTRTFIRIKFLNHQLKVVAESKRARNLKKIKHFKN